MDDVKQFLLKPVTGDTAERTIKFAAYGWYAVAGLQTLFLVRGVLHGSWQGGDLIGPVVAVIGARALLERKSRAAAAGLVGYAAFTVLSSLASFLGMLSNSANLLVALFALFAAWRGWQATVFWQKRRCVQVRWGRVTAATILATVATIIPLTLAMVLFTDAQRFWNLASFVFAAVLFLPTIGIMVWFTNRWPFAGADPACPWPPKK